MNVNFSGYTEILTGLADTISQGVIINSKLLILDGKRAIIYDLLNSNNKVKYLDEIGYIPTTQISRNPNGNFSVAYEKVNLIQDCRINQFLSNETDKVYQLDETKLNSINSVEVLNDKAQWIIKKVNTDYTIDLDKGQVIFKSAIGKSPVDGRDNVQEQIIEFLWLEIRITLIL